MLGPPTIGSTSTPSPAGRRTRPLAAGLVAGVVATGVLATSTPALADAVDIAPFCAAAPTSSRFADAGGFFAAEIACLEATGITRGVTPTQFAPDRTVTRAQMASLVVRLVDTAVALQATELNPLPERGGAAFTDVPAGSTHAEAVHRLAEAGIVQGGAGGGPADRFAPDLRVNRAQMATMLAGTYAWLTGEEIGPDGDAFADVATLDPQVQVDINVLASAGVTTGVSEGRYGPADPVRRRQMAAFLTRVLAVLEAADFVEPLRPVELEAEPA
ncbi:MAG: S-layer homology domain-containing protein [Actinomycetota bacterium]|nr:S-layer homology domain-containing protein [Actinomycetota bacterium]